MSQPAPAGHRYPFVGQTITSDVGPDVVYHLERGLGVGGTGTAYFAQRHTRDGRSPAVVKIIHPEIAIDAHGRATMLIQKEAVALGRLNEQVPPTPFVVRLLDTGVVEFRRGPRAIELPWLAIEYVHGGVEGTTLEQRVDYSVRQTGLAFDPLRAARALLALGTGLSEIHKVGVVHRDFTPGNVLCCGVGESEVLKISDFGIARPKGLAATFGDMLIGTPGYVAPEQAFQDDVDVGPYTDVFSLACVIYYVLTGKAYFPADSASEALLATRKPERRTVRDTPFLAPELRANDSACDAIDAALARATHLDPKQRPEDARAFAAGLIPWITEKPRSVRPNRRLMDSYMRLRVTDTIPGWTWTVRHPPGADRIVTSVGWDGDGHCLAVTTRGLAYWTGTDWIPAPMSDLPVPDGLKFVTRTAPGQWLVGSECATLAEYSRHGVGRVVRGPDESIAFTAASGDLEDLAAVVGEKAGSPPLLYGVAGGHWLRPLPLNHAAFVTGIARYDERRWLVVGRGHDGYGFAGVYSPLLWEILPIRVPPVRSLVACSSQIDRGVALAVGSDGIVIRLERGQVTGTMLDGQPHVASAAVDVLDREWAGGAGRLWVSPAGGSRWTLVFEEKSWEVPFTSILADVGLVVAMTADGGILECRSSILDQIVEPGQSSPPPAPQRTA